MKNWILISLMAYSVSAIAQTKIEKSIMVPAGYTIAMNFDFPELVQVHTWDKKEILVRGEVSINHGENDDAFELVTNSSNGTVSITSRLKNQESIPKRIIIRKGDQEYFFKTNDFHHPDVVKFLEENQGQYQYTSHGIIRKITLEIFVPQGVTTAIESKFGMVEVMDFNAPLTVVAKHGGIDARIKKATMGELRAKTWHGEILTNLDLKFDVSQNMDRHRDDGTEIKARLGNGYSYNFEASFGKIYLRKE